MDAYDRYCFAAGMGASSEDADAYAHRGINLRSSLQEDETEDAELHSSHPASLVDSACADDSATLPLADSLEGESAEGGDTQRTDV